MATYVAFLRGMNLGRRRVKNAELCACFKQMSFSDVWAFLASGNVVFGSSGKDAGDLERIIEGGLESTLGYEVTTFVRSAEEVASMARHKPFADEIVAASNGKLQVGILAEQPDASSRASVLELQTPEDYLSVDGRALYWLPSGRMTDSNLDLRSIDAALGQMTMRTQRTLKRLAEKIGV